MNDKKNEAEQSGMAQDQYLPRVVEHAVQFDKDGNVIEEDTEE